MPPSLWLALGLGLLAAALLAARALARRRPAAPPDWQRVLADTDYYRRTLAQVFPDQGYQVRGWRVFQAPGDDQPSEIIFSLRRDGTLYAALCVRWIIPVTSDVIGRFEDALRRSPAGAGLIVTTSIYTAAALERARGLPVQLYDRDDLQQWIARTWPAQA